MKGKRAKRKEIEKILRKFKFVMWDRFMFEESDLVTFYGWIAREDSYKDFLVLKYDAGEWWYITSSVKYDNEIRDILGDKERGIPCQSVQYHYEVKNVIKLKK